LAYSFDLEANVTVIIIAWQNETLVFAFMAFVCFLAAQVERLWSMFEILKDESNY